MWNHLLTQWPHLVAGQFLQVGAVKIVLPCIWIYIYIYVCIYLYKNPNGAGSLFHRTLVPNSFVWQIVCADFRKEFIFEIPPKIYPKLVLSWGTIRVQNSIGRFLRKILFLPKFGQTCQKMAILTENKHGLSMAKIDLRKITMDMIDFSKK